MSKLTTGLSPLTVEARDYDSVTLPVDAFEFSPSEKYVGLKEGWGFRTSLLTLSGAGSPLYSPVTGEEAIGTYHQSNRTVSAWDVITTTASEASPGTFDISALVPVGTKAVLIHGNVYYQSTSETPWNRFTVWNYDDGAFNAMMSILRGFRVVVPIMAATVGNYEMIDGEGMVMLGSSRKLYYGLNSAAVGATGQILLKGYWI